MDAPGGLNEERLDRALHDLFQDAGVRLAPEGLEHDVFEALAKPSSSSARTERPLISRTTWATLIVFAMGISVGVLIAPGSGTNAGRLTGWVMEQLPIGDLFGGMDLPWVLGALAAAACLLGLEALLSKPRMVARARRS